LVDIMKTYVTAEGCEDGRLMEIALVSFVTIGGLTTGYTHQCGVYVMPVSNVNICSFY
jgi:hypothetical protein